MPLLILVRGALRGGGFSSQYPTLAGPPIAGLSFYSAASAVTGVSLLWM